MWLWWLWLAVAFGGPGVPEDAGARAKERATALVDELGPRKAGTEAGEAAQRWVLRELRRMGWGGRTLKTHFGAVIGCKQGDSSRVVMFLAHTDTVASDVPGGNDNAAAMAVLIEAAAILGDERWPRTVCLGFPDAEEQGLRGSFALLAAAKAGALGGEIDQVMALDLVGIGTLTHHGLGPAFGERRLRHLLSVAPAEVPWVYRGISQAWVMRERSDHLPFSLEGIPATHLMARGVGGVDWAYHSPSDTADRLEEDTLQAAIEAVVGVASGPALPDEAPGSPAFVIPWTSTVVPGFATWFGLALGVLGLAIGAGGPKVSGREAVSGAASGSGQAVVGALAFGLGLFLAVGTRRMDLALAAPAAAAGWSAWAAVVLASPLETPPRVARVMGASSALLMGTALWGFGAPLLALPFAVAALGVGLCRWTRLGIIMSAWPALFLIRPNAIRELDFHYLFPAEPGWWVLVGGLLLLPVLGAIAGSQPEDPRERSRQQWLGVLFAVVTVGIWLISWTMPEEAPPWVDHHQR